MRHVLAIWLLLVGSWCRADQITLDPATLMTVSSTGATFPPDLAMSVFYHHPGYAIFDVPDGQYGGAAFLLDVEMAWRTGTVAVVEERLNPNALTLSQLDGQPNDLEYLGISGSPVPQTVGTLLDVADLNRGGQVAIKLVDNDPGESGPILRIAGAHLLLETASVPTPSVAIGVVVLLALLAYRCGAVRAR